MPNEYFVIGLYVVTVITNCLFFYYGPKIYVKKLEAKTKKQKWIQFYMYFIQFTPRIIFLVFYQ